MLVDAAKKGKHLELIRAALTAEAPPWPTKSLAALVAGSSRGRDPGISDGQESPDTVADIRGAWRLRRLAYDLDSDRIGAPRATRTADHRGDEREARETGMSYDASPVVVDKAEVVAWLARQRAERTPWWLVIQDLDVVIVALPRNGLDFEGGDNVVLSREIST